MKYIDTEKLIAYLKKTMESYKSQMVDPTKYPIDHIDLMAFLAREYQAIIANVESLQQEQPMPDSTKLIELWHEDKEMLKEKDFRDDPWRLAYNAFMCGFGRGIAVNKQEQPDVDLEKEIQSFWNANALEYRLGHVADINFLAYTARHFYNLGFNARNDDNR